MKRIHCILAGLALAGLSRGALAAPVITLNDGVNPPITVADNLAPDQSPTAGAVITITNVGVWNLVISSGSSKPLIGSPTNPVMDLSIQAISSGAGNLTVTLSDNGFSAGAGMVNAVISGLGANGSVGYRVFGDAGNNIGAQTTLLANVGTQALPVGANAAGSLSFSGAYSLTEVLNISATAAGNVSIDASLNATVTPPPACSASICGHIFADCDGSGSLTAGDVGLANVKVSLTDTNGNAAGSTTTDTNGGYCFNGLQPGTFVVVVTPPAGYQQTAGTTACHWRNNDGRDCWLDNDNYLHCKKSQTECWTDKDSCKHWKDDSGNDCSYDKSNNYHCQPCSYQPCSRSNCTTLADGRHCWLENDGNTHYDKTDAECWLDKDRCAHWKDDSGKDCSHDKSGGYHCSPCNYNPCDGRKDNTEIVTLAACQAKSSVDFAYTGIQPNVSICVSGPNYVRCGDTVTYTCTVTNTGNVCLKGGTVCHNIGNYDCNGWLGTPCTINIDCPPLHPGEGCQVQQQCTVNWSGWVGCVTRATCQHNWGTSSGQGGCATQVGWGGW